MVGFFHALNLCSVYPLFYFDRRGFVARSCEVGVRCASVSTTTERGTQMGSRTAWKIVTDNSGAATWLYSHWGGESKFEDTQNALVAAMPRWSDSSYGTRVFISNIVRENWSEETGFGITATLASAECPFEESYFSAVIDFTAQRVSLGSMEWSFEDFIVATDVTESVLGEGVN